MSARTEGNGVREYWIVDPDARELSIFSRREGRFGSPSVFSPGNPFTSDVLRGLRFDVGAVLP